MSQHVYVIWGCRKVKEVLEFTFWDSVIGDLHRIMHLIRNESVLLTGSLVECGLGCTCSNNPLPLFMRFDCLTVISY